MKTSVQRAALSLCAVIVVVPASVRAQDNASTKLLYEVVLDIDRDGKTDRAVVVRNPESIYSELRLYRRAGEEPPDVLRKPDFLKSDLTTDPVLGLEARSNGSLVVKYGRSGSNQYEMALTVVYRGGKFLVAGFTKSWDTRGSIGSCDVNFLTGTGVASHGLGRSKPIKARFAPVKLADWSDEREPGACH